MQAKQKWMDEVTAVWMDFDWVWQQLEPLSPFGQKYKAEFQPFNSLSSWQQELMQTQCLEEHIEDQHKMDKLNQAFSSIKEICPFLELLNLGEAGTETDWYRLKQFLWESRSLFKLLLPCEPAFASAYKLANQLLHHLQPEQRSFALEDTAQNLYQLRQRKIGLIEKQQELRIEQRKQIEQELGVKLQGKALIFVSLKDETQLNRCKEHPSLSLERETPFEAIFSINITAEEREYAARIELLEEAIEKVEKEQLHYLAEQVRPYLDELLSWCPQLGLWDFRWAKVKWRKKLYRAGFTTCWPTLAEEIKIIECRYLPLERQLVQEGKSYIPLNVTLTSGLSTIVGSNMSGKSVALKTIGLACALAHYGLPVPAASCSLPFLKQLIAISGDLQDSARGLSTFGAELERLAEAIKGKESLLLLDEIARGTNPIEGEALAQAIAQYFAEQEESFSVLITHFPILAAVEQAKHYRMIGYEEDGSKCHHLIESTEEDIPQYALKLAEQYGLPDTIIHAAYQKIKERDRHGKAAFKSK